MRRDSGETLMTPGLYKAAASMAKEWRSGLLPQPYRITGEVTHEVPLAGTAVYVAVDGAAVIRYVGSVARGRETGVKERSAEHLREWFKAMNWTNLYVVPLRMETPEQIVKAIEGRIGRRLRPIDNKRLPAIR